MIIDMVKCFRMEEEQYYMGRGFGGRGIPPFGVGGPMGGPGPIGGMVLAL